MFNLNYWDDVTGSEAFGKNEIVFFTFTAGSGDTYKDFCDAAASNSFYAGANAEILKRAKLYLKHAAPDTHIDVFNVVSSSDNGVTLAKIVSSDTYFGEIVMNIPIDTSSTTTRYRTSRANTSGTITVTDGSSTEIGAGSILIFTTIL